MKFPISNSPQTSYTFTPVERPFIPESGKPPARMRHSYPKSPALSLSGFSLFLGQFCIGLKIVCLIVVSSWIHPQFATASFVERLPVYGVVKPGRISTSLAVNNGMISRIPHQVGDKVRPGTTLMTAIEKETTRSYRSTIQGQVAKLHVTQGAAVTPGMPLVTVLNPDEKKLEVSLAPQEARKIKVGAEVFKRNGSDVIGEVHSISPLVDPDTGGVLSYIKARNDIAYPIGDVIPLDVAIRSLDGCKVVPLNEIDQFLSEYEVKATSGTKACLVYKTENQENR